jgi:ribosomal protein S18 acetylase RimI-like enzyme
MQIRKASPDDAEVVRRVADAAWHDAHDDIVGADAVEAFLSKYYAPADLRERYRDGYSTTFVATVDGAVVGYATGVPDDDAYSLGSIYVHPDRQGEGVGSRLLERVEREARASIFDTLRLVVMADNEDAVGFYEARGFERAGDHYDEFLDVDGYVYEKSLSP